MKDNRREVRGYIKLIFHIERKILELGLATIILLIYYYILGQAK